MNIREIFHIQEKRRKIFDRDKYKCQVCGDSIMKYNTPQLAHILPQSKMMIRKYGEKIIQHSSNMKSVCSLECNNKAEIKKGGRQEQEHVNMIKDKIKRAMWRH